MSSPEYSCGERTSTSLRVGVQRREDLVALGADRVVAGLGGEGRGRVAGHVGGRRPALADPLLARAVDELDVVVAVVLQVPVRVGREPVVAVAVEHDRVLVGDAARAEERAELLRPEEVALDLVLQVGLPVESDRAGDVRLGVERRVLVDLDDADRVVVEVVLDPLGVDEDVLRVVGHRFLLIPIALAVFHSSLPPAREDSATAGVTWGRKGHSGRRPGLGRRLDASHDHPRRARGGPVARAGDQRRPRIPRRPRDRRRSGTSS